MIKDLIPWRRESENPIQSLRESMNKLFEDFLKDFEEGSLLPSTFERGEFVPRIDVAETDKDIQVSAELPGMTDKDIKIFFENNVLTIQGEKKQEEKKEDKNYHYVERRYGSFYRSIPIHAEIDSEKIEAVFKNGVLTITLPKKEEKEAKGTQIKIKTE